MFPPASSTAGSEPPAPEAPGTAQGHRHCRRSCHHPHSSPQHNTAQCPARTAPHGTHLLGRWRVCSPQRCAPRHPAAMLPPPLPPLLPPWALRDEPEPSGVRDSPRQYSPFQQSWDTAGPPGLPLVLGSQPRTTELLCWSRHLCVISVPVPPVSRTTLSQLSSLGGAVIPGSRADLQGLGRLPSTGLFNLLPTEWAKPMAPVPVAPAGCYSGSSIGKALLQWGSPCVGQVRAPMG